jgi:plasmid maintenance system killer protein
MRVEFKDYALLRLCAEYGFMGGYPPAVVSAYRSRIQLLYAAPREHALLPLLSLRMILCEGTGRHTMRVTDEWELIVNFEGTSKERVAVVEKLVERID